MNSMLRNVYTVLMENCVTPISVIEALRDKSSEAVVEVTKGFFGIKYLNAFDLEDIYNVTRLQGIRDLIKTEIAGIDGIDENTDLGNLPAEDFKAIYRHTSELECEFNAGKIRPLEALYAYYWVNNKIAARSKYNNHYADNSSTKLALPSDVDLRRFKRQGSLYAEYDTYVTIFGECEPIDNIIPKLVMILQSKYIREELSLQKQEISDATEIKLNMLAAYESRMQLMSDEVVDKIRTEYINNLYK